MGSNVFLIFVFVPILAGLALMIADWKIKNKPLLKLAWKNLLGTHTFYGILMVAYGQFCYLLANAKHFSAVESPITFIFSSLFAVLTIAYVVGFLKVPRWFGSFKNKFLIFNIAENYYVFSTLERLITPTVIVFLSPYKFAGIIVSAIFISEAIFIAVKQPYHTEAWKRPLANKILAATISILTTCAAANPSSSIAQTIIPIFIEVILMIILSYSIYSIVKQWPINVE